MTDREKQIIKSIAVVIPKMSDFQKGYFLGAAEAMAERKKTVHGESEERGA